MEINQNDATHKHIVTPTDHEMEVLIKRRKLYKSADQELARDWVYTAKKCKEQRMNSNIHGSTNSEVIDRAFMDFPANLWQRLEKRFGPKWFQDKKLKKKVWDMYPEFRLREKF